MAESNNKLPLDSMGGFVYYSLDKILKLTTKTRDKRLRTAAFNVQKAIFVAFQKVCTHMGRQGDMTEVHCSRSVLKQERTKTQTNIFCLSSLHATTIGRT